MSNEICIHFYVAGKVQGVWFRAHTKKEAEQLGVTGWVRNLPDGRVEVMACGTSDNITKLREWLKQGPPRASVTELSHEDLPWREYKGFEIL